jgi:catechol 2,3-dioxygenase-like lactoylglutathione lyase family enzyme
MLGIQKVDHVGIRISDKHRSTQFYENLGFELVVDSGFDDGHPIVMRHASGLVFNLLGPATKGQGENILMDVDDKYPGYTHVAVKIDSIEDAERFFADQGIQITGRREFRGVKAVFIRDPDRNVLEIIGPGPDVVDLISDHNHGL